MDAKSKVFEVLKANGGLMHEKDIAAKAGISINEVRKNLLLLHPSVASAQQRDCYYTK